MANSEGIWILNRSIDDNAVVSKGRNAIYRVHNNGPDLIEINDNIGTKIPVPVGQSRDISVETNLRVSLSKDTDNFSCGTYSYIGSLT